MRLNQSFTLETCEIKDIFLNWIIEYVLYIWRTFGRWSPPIFVCCVRCRCRRCCTAALCTGGTTHHTGSASFWQEMAQYLVIWTPRLLPRQMKTYLSSHIYFSLKIEPRSFCQASKSATLWRKLRLEQFLFNFVFNGSFNVWETKM